MIDRIKELTGIDITDKTRKRNVVELKALYCYLMKQKGNTYTSIGKKNRIESRYYYTPLQRVSVYKKK